MITKELLLGLYESSLLSRSGSPLTVGWKEIANFYPEPEVTSLFTKLSSDFLSGKPSFKPFEENVSLKNDYVVACHFAELAAASGVYDTFWYTMGVAYLLKKKLASSVPTEVDVRLGSYLLSFGDGVSGMSLRKEIESWTDAKNWKFPEHNTEENFPEEWWGTFTGIDTNDIQFPRSITLLLKSCLAAGTLDTVIPETAVSWTRFVKVADQLFAK